MPFEQAASELQALLGIGVSASTVRRQTEQAGAIVEQIHSEQARQQTGSCRFPVPQDEPAERLAISSDGGMVPLRAGVWAEVKTLVIGEVGKAAQATGEATTIRTTAHSYFSRLTDAATFADLASVEIARRGVERAQAVCAVQDGAEWLQSFVDGHRHDAVRILDFAHAANYLGQIAEQGQQVGRPLPRGWMSVLLHQLKHHGPRRVLKHLEGLECRRALPAIGETLRYFRKRLAQLQYPQFQADGWPIGSGMVESANKVVMQARLKGAGMHWEPANVNPMLALRTTLCNARWAETWSQVQQWRHEARHAHRKHRCEQRRTRLLLALQRQLLRWSLLLPRPVPASHPSHPRGRTAGQKRWGRQSFSPRAILEGRYAKK
jgi:hypothetical protein